jgi:hypothetical protein
MTSSRCASALCIRYDRVQGSRIKVKDWEVTASSANLATSRPDFGISWVVAAWKEILNQLTRRAEAAVDLSRLGTLPLRYLDDVGMTVGERAAILGYEEPAHDPWSLVAIQRL